MRCRKCGYSPERLACLALLVDLGGECYPPPSECIEGGEHEFSKVEEKEHTLEDTISEEYRNTNHNMGD